MYGYHACPKCGQSEVVRSRTRGVERLVKRFTSYRPFRCLSCGWRGWCRKDSATLRPLLWRVTRLHPHQKA